MSYLSNLQRKIYSQNFLPSDRPEGDLGVQKSPEGDLGWKEPATKSFFFRHIWIISASFIVVFGSSLFLLFGTGGFSENNVVVTIDAPQEVNGVEVLEFRVNITNKNRVDLENVALGFEYPEYAQPVDDDKVAGRASTQIIGLLGAGSDVERTFKARLFGGEDTLQKVRVLVSYKAPGISREFEEEVFSQVTITSSPVLLTFQGPAELQVDTAVGWTLKVSNISDYDFSNLRVRLVYPAGFTFIGANPQPQFQQTAWEIPSLKVGQEKSIQLQGKIEGSLNDRKELQAFLEFPPEGTTDYIVLTQKIATSKITIEPLSLSLAANGSESIVAYTGDTVTVEVFYKNNTSNPINDVVVDAQLVGEPIDPTSIETQGSYDPASLHIRWDFGNTPELKEVLPSQDGKLTAMFAIKNKLTIKRITDKNFQARVVSTIASERPVGGSGTKIYKQQELVIPIGTNLLLQIQGDKDSTRFPNSGSIPPIVDRQTTYTIIWRLTNTSNDVGDLQIVAPLPSWATFTGMKQVNFETDNFYYDKDKRQVIWTMKKLPATTGFALPVYEAAFQIGITPGDEHAGKIIDIIGAVEVKGIDMFTNELLRTLYDPFKTDLGGTLSKGQSTVSQ